MKRRTLIFTGGALSLLAAGLGTLMVYDRASLPVQKTMVRRPRGVALVVGVGRLTKGGYGLVDPLEGYSGDVKCIASMLRQRKFTVPEPLVDVTAKQFLDSIESAGKNDLVAGDTFVLYFSGHGCLIPHRGLHESLFQSTCSQTGPPPVSSNGVPLEPAWCLADRAVLGSEVYDAIRRTFADGVHVLVIADSCHSGRMVATPQTIIGTFRAKQLGDVYERDPSLYDRIAAAVPREPKNKKLGADISLLAACRDSEETPDGQSMSLFTTRLARLWFAASLEEGCEVLTPQFSGTLQELSTQLSASGPPTPQLFCPPGAKSTLLNRAAFSY